MSPVLTNSCAGVRGIRLLYISYWGIREPLGQSLMLPPLLRFAAAGVSITLVSFEKPNHLADRSGMEESRRQLESAGIRWIPLRYHKRPTAPATAFDIVYGAARSLLASLRHRPDIIHGRTFVGGLIGSLVSRILRRTFIYHSEGFWPDEQVAGGFWQRDSRQYRITKRMEAGLFCQAAAAITLSQPARELILPWRKAWPEDSSLIVPSCVDLESFIQAKIPANRIEGILIYVGSLGGRYSLKALACFLRAFRYEIPMVHLKIYSHSDPAIIRNEFRNNDIEDNWWSLDSLPYKEIPHALNAAQVGLHLLEAGGLYVGSPTKIGEYWACGLPVVTTPEVGDIDAIVRREQVGVVVEADTEDAYRAAAKELRVLLQDPELPDRCRYAAERYYSLERGVEAQLGLYRRLTADAGKRVT